MNLIVTKNGEKIINCSTKLNHRLIFNRKFNYPEIIMNSMVNQNWNWNQNNN